LYFCSANQILPIKLLKKTLTEKMIILCRQ
jgi:hypothetical protein